MTDMKNKQPNFVTVIIKHTIDNKPHILMILVDVDNMDAPYWTLPGGRVEQGETGIQATIRETQEETGITIIELETLAYHVQVDFDDVETHADIYVTDKWEGEIQPNDPDGKVVGAKWMPLAQAITHLSKIDYPPMSEPPVAYLAGKAEQGRQWYYRVDGDGAVWVRNT
ncbi:MAG: NUDIX hydrolase [Chloroflexota bacterium]